MSTHPVDIVMMALIFAVVFGVVLAVTVTLTLHLDRRRHAAVRQARHPEGAPASPPADLAAARTDA